MTITRRNYILVDFENTQLIFPESLVGMPVKLVLFTGQGQKALPIELVKRLLPLGSNAEIRESAGNGKNAVDFQLSFYSGRVFEREPEAFIHIVSKDKGFDPLIAHMKSEGRQCSRVDSFDLLGLLKARSAKEPAEKEDPKVMSLSQRVEFVIGRLLKIAAASRPRKVKTLTTAVHSHFSKQLPFDDIEKIVKELQRRNVITVGDKESVAYDLPV